MIISSASEPQLWVFKMPTPIILQVGLFSQAVHDGDGLISFGISEMDQQATHAMEESLGKDIPLFPVGWVQIDTTGGHRSADIWAYRPQLGIDVWNENNPKNRTTYSSEEKEIMDFLDNAENKYGKRCAVYIR